MAFATSCSIRNLFDGPASALVPAESNFRIGFNRKHRRSTRALSQRSASGCASPKLTGGLRDRSTTSLVFSQHAGGCEKPQRLSQATTDPADRPFADRPVVAAEGNGITHG
jgi:hypothetical protein